MAKLTIIGLPAYDLSNITIGLAEVSTLPKSNLADPEPWRVCRLNSIDPVETYCTAQLSMPNNFYSDGVVVGGVALPNVNLGLGSRMRVVLGDATFSGGAPQRMPPTGAVGSVTGFSGSYLDVDDNPFSLDGNSMDLAAGAGAGIAKFSFGTPTGTLDSSENAQAFRVVCNFASGYPTTLAFTLCENGGTEIRLLAYQHPGADPAFPEGEVFYLYWSTTELSDPSGADVELQVVGFTGASNSIEIEAIDWLATKVGTGVLDDSGWLDVAHDEQDASWGFTVGGALGLPPQQTPVYVPATPVSGAHYVAVYFEDQFNTDGFIDVGRLLVGPGFTPETDRDWGELVEIVGRDVVNETDGGSWPTVRRPPLRKLTIPFHKLTVDEANSITERVWRAGLGTKFVVATLPGDYEEGRHLNLYVRLASLPKVTKPKDYSDVRQITLETIECL